MKFHGVVLLLLLFLTRKKGSLPANASVELAIVRGNVAAPAHHILHRPVAERAEKVERAARAEAERAAVVVEMMVAAREETFSIPSIKTMDIGERDNFLRHCAVELVKFHPTSTGAVCGKRTRSPPLSRCATAVRLPGKFSDMSSNTRTPTRAPPADLPCGAARGLIGVLTRPHAPPEVVAFFRPLSPSLVSGVVRATHRQPRTPLDSPPPGEHFHPT
ncbi:hypothetical protein Salat_2628000 [Sesamum alatum]|uniref:Secreted protein n=1 Tax=Sesamum alatum TaxID=300844 RepID=A0AAE1XNM8_9LAMI|nr:hypothetical protein Salat_2628000 [Sesamum alatum]